MTSFVRRFTYFPDASPVPPAGEVIEGARDVTLHTEDGLELGAWFVPAGGRRRVSRWLCWSHPGTAAAGSVGPASQGS